MSRPSELYVSRDNEKFTKVFLGKRAAMDLCNYISPRVGQIAPEFEIDFDYESVCEFVSILTLPQKYFSAVYTLIMNACDELESLKPYHDDLKQALESDPRYQAAQ